MTRLAQLHGAVNLSQGFPDFPAPEEVKEAARRAIADDVNQYAITWGAQLAARGHRRASSSGCTACRVDPEREITVTCGSTEAMIATLLAVLDPGDEVIVVRALLRELRARTRSSPARRRASCACARPTGPSTPTSWRRAFSRRTRAIIVNTPHNPTGKVFTRDGAGRPSPTLCLRARRAGHHRRDLRAHPLRRRAARAHGHAARHGRAHRSPSTA